MISEFFIEKVIPDVTAIFANGGRLEKSGVLWVYERDGKSSLAREPEVAITGAEGIGKGMMIWNSEGGESNMILEIEHRRLRTEIPSSISMSLMPELEGFAGELSEGETLSVESLLLEGVNAWLRQSGRYQTIRSSDRSIQPLFRVDQQAISGQNPVTVLFEKDHGPVEDSEFILKGAFRIDRIGEVNSRLRDRGYEVNQRETAGAVEMVLLAA